MADQLLAPAELSEENTLSAESALVATQVQALVEGEMLVDRVEAPGDPQREGLVALHGRLLRPSEEVFPRWLTELTQRGYTPMLQPVVNGERDLVILRIIRGVAPEAHPRVWINALLFGLTVISTLFVGSMYGGSGVVVDSVWDLLRPQNLIQGLPFAATLLGILSAHEFGHYFAARYHKVAVTLPYFIPMPLTFGTMGAFIQLKAPISNRRKLFDIGVAGPLAGLVLAIPLLIYGLSTSPMEVPKPSPGALMEGNSILYFAAKFLIFGKVLPNALTGEDVLMNQVTFAAWIGLLVTALNLLPVGQLDGGHTVFALFGVRARIINLATLAIMALLAIAGLESVQAVFPALQGIGYSGWFVWLGLIILVIGPFHPPALDDVTELDPPRRWVGYLVLLLFILTFVPVPLRPL